MKPKKFERPRDVRFPHNRRGELSYNGSRFPCLIQDISISGFLIICARNPVVEQELDLRFELTHGHVHQCKVQVKHIDDGCLGSVITDVGENEGRMFKRFVERHSVES